MVSALVQNLDYAPTILDYAGITKPAELQGESFRELAARRQVKNWRKAIYFYFDTLEKVKKKAKIFV